MAQINYPIPDELRNQWKALCANMGIKMKDRVIDLIKIDIKKKGLKE